MFVFPFNTRITSAMIRWDVLVEEPKRRIAFDKLQEEQWAAMGSERIRNATVIFIENYHGDFVQLPAKAFWDFCVDHGVPPGNRPNGRFGEMLIRNDPEKSVVRAKTKELKRVMYEYAPLGSIYLTSANTGERLDVHVYANAPYAVVRVDDAGLVGTILRISSGEYWVVESVDDIHRLIKDARERAFAANFWKNLRKA